MKNSDTNQAKQLNETAVIWRKFLPFIPILGIPLTMIFHKIYEDTGIENDTINWITSFIQSISIVILVYAI